MPTDRNSIKYNNVSYNNIKEITISFNENNDNKVKIELLNNSNETETINEIQNENIKRKTEGKIIKLGPINQKK